MRYDDTKRDEKEKAGEVSANHAVGVGFASEASENREALDILN